MYTFPVSSLDVSDRCSLASEGGASARGAFAEQAVDVRIFEPHDAASHDLLEAAYDKLFRQFFSGEEYQEPLDKWHLLVDEKKSPWKHIIGISGTNLDHAGRRDIAGMFVGVYYKCVDYVLDPKTKDDAIKIMAAKVGADVGRQPGKARTG